jgi:hypothetical protein
MSTGLILHRCWSPAKCFATLDIRPKTGNRCHPLKDLHRTERGEFGWRDATVRLRSIWCLMIAFGWLAADNPVLSRSIGLEVQVDHCPIPNRRGPGNRGNTLSLWSARPSRELLLSFQLAEKKDVLDLMTPLVENPPQGPV